MTNEADKQTYAEAIAELETILEQIEASNIDVDKLSDGVERAAELLKFCRATVAKAETRIVEVLAEIEEEEQSWSEEQSKD
jgi:exodeoxyribonuclease VII small subunit